MSANFLNILFNTLWNNLSFDTCPTGMVRVGKHCYLFINKFNTFTEASETCTSHGLQLVTVRGMSEISEFLKSRQNNLCGDRNIFWLNKDKNNIIHEREEHFNFTIKRYNKRNSFWYYINCKESYFLQLWWLWYCYSGNWCQCRYTGLQWSSLQQCYKYDGWHWSSYSVPTENYSSL